MKNLTIFAILLFSVTAGVQNASQKEEWISLFNGKDLTGWEIKIADFPVNEYLNKPFLVEDSMIRVRYDNYDEFNDHFGHMYYYQPFSYYKLKFYYRFVGEQLKGIASAFIKFS